MGNSARGHAEDAGFKKSNKYPEVGLTGQSLPTLRRVKYCTLRGRSGYIFTSPILRDRTRMPVLICASATPRWVRGIRGRHEANSCRYAALKSQQPPIHAQTRSRITLFEGKKIQLKNNTTSLPPALHQAIAHLCGSRILAGKNPLTSRNIRARLND